MSFKKKNQIQQQEFDSITISLASPDDILERSFGEVLKPETINYRSYKPERDGLFCERIFGPVKDYECYCGKYKRIRYKGIVCDRCGVEVTEKKVRRERMGHIKLVVPVVHIWFFKSLPNKIGYLLGLSSKKLETIVYYERYIVIQPGVAESDKVKLHELLTEEEYLEIMDNIPHENIQDCPFFGGSISPQKQNIFSSNDTDKRELFEKGIHQQNIFNNDINFDSEKKQFALNPIDNK